MALVPRRHATVRALALVTAGFAVGRRRLCPPGRWRPMSCAHTHPGAYRPQTCTSTHVCKGGRVLVIHRQTLTCAQSRQVPAAASRCSGPQLACGLAAGKPTLCLSSNTQNTRNMPEILEIDTLKLPKYANHTKPRPRVPGGRLSERHLARPSGPSGVKHLAARLPMSAPLVPGRGGRGSPAGPRLPVTPSGACPPPGPPRARDTHGSTASRRGGS